jgi:AcrR family transcriptional regulator
VACTLRMLDREGPDALSFRAVARELGITVGALSRYFKSLADLEDEVAAKIISDLRPLEASSLASLRRQLLRLGMDMLEISRTHPYLVKIHGPVSAAVVARHTRQCLEVLVNAGLSFERAMAIYSLVGNLPAAWAMQSARERSPESLNSIWQAFSLEMGAFAPQMTRLVKDTRGTTIHRRWLALYIDALLPPQ